MARRLLEERFAVTNPEPSQFRATKLRWVHALHFHDLVGVAALLQQLGHGLHRLVDVADEGLVAGAEIVQPVFVVRRRAGLIGTAARAGVALVAQLAAVAAGQNFGAGAYWQTVKRQGGGKSSDTAPAETQRLRWKLKL